MDTKTSNNIPTQTPFHEEATHNSAQIKTLKQHFPQCFHKDGRFMPDKMAALVGNEGTEITREYFHMDWLGKSYARLLANMPPETMMTPDTAHNQKPDNINSQNLLLKGDNLEVLKHMVNGYREAVKMIYIDPPYNTGGDGFVYNDDRKFTPEELSQMAGIDEDEAKRILDFTKKGSSAHSAWLTFMYPRLYVARHLLRDDGVIFISIDDNEQAQLKLLCDEVFGEENFISQFVIQTNPRGRSLAPFVAKTFEYVICYAKNALFKGIKQIPKGEKSLKEYNKEDENGKYRLLELRNRNPAFNRENRPNLYFPIYVDEKTGKVSLEKTEQFSNMALPLNSKGEEGCWTWSMKKVKEENDLLVGKKVETGVWRVYRKDYIPKNGAFTKEKSLWIEKAMNHENGKEEIARLFGTTGNKSPFDFPKSVDLISKCLRIGLSKADIILDFFAGSGTTGHAVMKMNAEDGGNRQYICVQLPEATDAKSEAFKAGYQTIFDITKERLIRAAVKIGEEHPDYAGDLGFRVYETVPNFLPDLDLLQSPQSELDVTLVKNLDDAQQTALLTSWCLYDGYTFSTPPVPVDLGGYTAYHCGDHLYCIAGELSADRLAAFLEKLDADKDFNPKTVVLYGHGIASARQREAHEGITQYAGKKGLQLSVVVRY